MYFNYLLHLNAKESYIAQKNITFPQENSACHVLISLVL